jgi:TonB family protein
MPSLLRAAGVCLAVYLVCGSARAQTAPDVTPPVAQTSTDVPYPAGAQGDAAVVLELIVEKDGSVSSITVIEGVPPFAEQAQTAALTWRFAPAQQNNAPVAARIRARVLFHQELEPEPALPPPTAAPDPGPTTPAPPPPPPPPPMEITVVGVRREIGQTTLDKDDVRLMPGAFGDAFRAIEALPGVTPLASGIPYYYVRGAPPNTAGYFIDGVRVPLLFHLGLAQSVIHPGLVERVDFFPSAAPARYGGFAGGIVAGETRAPASAFHGEANLRVVDAGALVEAPLAGQRATALVAGRYGFPGPILAAISDLKIDYWDYQARATYNFDQKNAVGVFAFGSHDYFATRSPSGDPQASQEYVEQFVSDFHRLDLRYDHALGDGRLRVAVTGGHDSMGQDPSYFTNHSVATRVEVEQRLGSSLRYRGGLDAQLDRYRVRLLEPGPGEPLVPYTAVPPPTNLSGGIHSDLVWRVSPKVELVPGARFALFGSERQRASPATGRERVLRPAIDPRLAARLTLTNGLAWLSSLGLSHQYPSLRLGNVPAPMASIPGFPFGVRRLQRAAQLSQGFELALPADLVLSTTGFFTHWSGLTDLSASCYQYAPGFNPEPTFNNPAPYVCPDNDPVRGHAYGAELLLRRAFTKKLSGWLSYTLSRTLQQSRFITPRGTQDIATVPSEFDRTHVLNAVLGYDLGRRWHFGSRFVFYTGTPYSKLDGSIPVPPYRAYRGDPFYRVDVRLEKRWRVGQSGSVALVLEGLNVTLQKEVTNLGQECEGRSAPGEGETTYCEPSEIGPLTIPSIGLEAFF